VQDAQSCWKYRTSKPYKTVSHTKLSTGRNGIEFFLNVGKSSIMFFPPRNFDDVMNETVFRKNTRLDFATQNS